MWLSCRKRRIGPGPINHARRPPVFQAISAPPGGQTVAIATHLEQETGENVLVARQTLAQDSTTGVDSVNPGTTCRAEIN